MSIYTKLLEVQKKCIVVAKDTENPFFKNKYASLDTIIVAYSTPLSDNWLVVTHCNDLEKSILVTTITDTENGEIIKTEFPIKFDVSPQAIGSQLTYAKRYNLWALLNIATDEDDDGNNASKEKETKEKLPSANNPKAEKVRNQVKLNELQKQWINKMWNDKYELLTRRYQLAYGHPTADLLTDDQIGEMKFTVQDYETAHLEEFINNLIKENEVPSEK